MKFAIERQAVTTPMGRCRVKIGDVFAVPCDQGDVAIVQFVSQYSQSTWHVVVLGGPIPVSTAEAEWESIANTGPVVLCFGVLSMRAQDGSWPRLGNRRPREFPIPPFVESTIERGRIVFNLVDVAGRVVGRVSEAESYNYHTRTFGSPAELESVIKARFGRKPWNDRDTLFVPAESWDLNFDSPER